MPLLIHTYMSKHKGKRGKCLPALSLQMFFKEEACLSARHPDSYLCDPHRLMRFAHSGLWLVWAEAPIDFQRPNLGRLHIVTWSLHLLTSHVLRSAAPQKTKLHKENLCLCNRWDEKLAYQYRKTGYVMAKVAWGIKRFPQKVSWFKRGVEALPSLPGDWSCCTSVSTSPLQIKARGDLCPGPKHLLRALHCFEYMPGGFIISDYNVG